MEEEVEFEYRNIIKEPLSAEELKSIGSTYGLTAKELINPRSQAFKKMKEDLGEMSADRALELLVENPRIMYRPLITRADKITMGPNYSLAEIDD